MGAGIYGPRKKMGPWDEGRKTASVWSFGTGLLIAIGIWMLGKNTVWFTAESARFISMTTVVIEAAVALALVFSLGEPGFKLKPWSNGFHFFLALAAADCVYASANMFQYSPAVQLIELNWAQVPCLTFAAAFMLVVLNPHKRYEDQLVFEAEQRREEDVRQDYLAR